MNDQQQYLTTRIGVIAYGQEDVVHFPEGLLGFPEQKNYVVVEHKEGSPFRWLLSLEDTNLAFLAVDPALYVSDYAPPMPKSAAEALKLEETTPMLVYTIVTIPSGRPEDMTLNLAGPVVLNCDANLGKQIVLDNEAYSVRHRAFAAKEQEQAA